MFVWSVFVLRVERQAKILQLIREKGFVANDELATIFNVTQATIRRDLKSLKGQNLIRLDHGGSYDVDYLTSGSEPLYETKVYVNKEHKRLIGQATTDLISDNETIFLDSGTTNGQIAHFLCGKQLENVTVVTCDIVVAHTLGSDQNINVLVLGGIVRKSFYSLYGPYTEMVLKNIRADKLFLGIDAASVDAGISNIVLEEVPIKQLMIQNCDQVVMVADSTKFGINAPYKVCSWDAIDHVITDDCIEKNYIEFLDNHEISTTIVNMSDENCDE
jgi:DeoR/GlpR family transcriptional regulator of sugar metabolism